MSWEIVTAKHEFQNYRNDWDRLNQQLNEAHPMLDSRFVSRLMDFFAEDDLKLAIYQQNGQVENLLLIEKRNAIQWGSFQPGQSQVGCYLIGNEASLKSLVPTLGLFTLIFDLSCFDIKYPSGIQMVFDNQYFYARTINIAKNQTFEEYWKPRPRKLQTNMRRYIKRAEEQFESVSLKIASNNRETVAALSRYGDIESKGWKGKLGTAINDNNNQGKFYKTIIEDYSQTEQVKIYELLFDGTVVASRIAIHNNDMLLMLKTTYLEDFKKYAPGRILLYRVLEHEFSQGQQNTIEFYTNASKEQIEWSTDSRNINHIRLYRNRTSQGLIEWLKKLKQSLVFK